MNNYLVSIIIPVYNVEKYIDQCIQSVREQSLLNIEIILVDDGSTDSCPEICDNYGKLDNRIKVIHQKNKGLSGARNTGILNSTGEYIFFLDSDDWIEQNTIELLYNRAKSDNTDIVVCNVNICSNSGNIEKKKYWPFSNALKMLPENIYPYFLIQPCWVWNKLYKSSFLKNNNFYFKEGILYEDVPFFTETFLNVKSISFIPNHLYNYRVGRDGAITVKKSVKQFDLITVRNIVLSLLKKHEVPQLIYNNFQNWSIYNFIWMYKHLPKIYRMKALQEIDKYPFADNIYELLDLKKIYISIFGINLFSIKKVPSRLDIFFLNTPIITLRKIKRYKLC